MLSGFQRYFFDRAALFKNSGLDRVYTKDPKRGNTPFGSFAVMQIYLGKADMFFLQLPQNEGHLSAH